MVNTLDVGVVELLVDVVSVDGTEVPDEVLDGGAELGLLGSEEVEVDAAGGSEEVGEFELDGAAELPKDVEAAAELAVILQDDEAAALDEDGAGGSELNEELEELEGSAELDSTEVLAAAEEDVVEANVEEAAA
jgi:hypothetical protein